MGNNDKVAIRKDVCIGYVGNYRISRSLNKSLTRKSINCLIEAVYPTTSSIWNQGLKSVYSLQLHEDEEKEMNQIILGLQQSSIGIKDEEDVILWSKSSSMGRFLA